MKWIRKSNCDEIMDGYKDALEELAILRRKVDYYEGTTPFGNQTFAETGVLYDSRDREREIA